MKKSETRIVESTEKDWTKSKGFQTNIELAQMSSVLNNNYLFG